VSIPHGILQRSRAEHTRRLLTDRCSIQRLAESPLQDAGGAVLDDWATLRTNVPCRLRLARRQREVIEADAVQAQADWEAVFVVGTDVQPADRLVHQGQVYDVIGTDGGRTEALCLTAQLVRRD
jgi:head-tail adaptor